MAGTNVSLPSSSTRRLEGKVALITGGAMGIGECTARLFCQQGAKVVIADIRDDLGQVVCNEIGPLATYVHCDVTVEDDVKNAVDKVVADHGKLDVMFNNAGVVDGPYSRITAVDKSAVERVMATNFIGVLLGTKHAARVMSPLRRGCIINNGSVSSVVGGIAPHGYMCSKHAVVGLTKNAAVELGQVGVRVNCVSSSALGSSLATNGFGMGSDEALEDYIEAGGVLKGVKLKAVDVAEAVVFLASDESRYISGHNLLIDGAFSKVNSAIPSYKYND